MIIRLIIRYLLIKIIIIMSIGLCFSSLTYDKPWSNVMTWANRKLSPKEG